MYGRGFLLKRTCHPSVGAVDMEKDCCAPPKQHPLLKTEFFLKIAWKMQNLVDVSGIFFCSGAGEREEASEEVAGVSVSIENRRRGGGEGLFEEKAREGEGGVVNILFGAEITTRKRI